MKYDVLILDHDDTCVESTSAIHYPAHLAVMSRIRPETKPVSLNEWFEKNFDPGIMEFLIDDLDFSPDEIELEKKIWRKFTETKVPDFYPGIISLLREFRRKGGSITVVSHSEAHIIRSFYKKYAPEIIPDLIFGWNDDPEKRKPHPWPAQEILRKIGAEPERALLVDDLKPGIEMAKAVGIPAAGAGWGHCIPGILNYMQKNTDVYLRTVDEFRLFLEI